MANPQAAIRSQDKRSPLSLRVVQTSKGVFFDLLDKADPNNGRRFVISVRPKSAHLLAQWILDNVTTTTTTEGE